jgi:hypothetical protein
VAERLFLICGTLFVFVLGVARGEGSYQRTRDNKTLVWNSHPNAGDVATWSGARDREGYARGFGRLAWYTKESGFDKPQLYARYWGRMVDGKFEGPVNVHSRRRTDYAIFISGARVTGWRAGTASARTTARWRTMVATRRTNVESASAEKLRRGEPKPPAAGPMSGKSEITDQRSEVTESIQDLWTERWPKIDMDDSLRLLAFPPRSLRLR